MIHADFRYTIEQSTTDTTALPGYLEEFNKMHSTFPDELTADAGFGSEENYEFLWENEITPYVKFNYFHKEQSKKWKKDIFRQENLYYNSEMDCFYCPMGQEMKKEGTKKGETKTGYVQEYTLYQAINCKGCPLRGQCHKSKKERIIAVSHKLRYHKEKVRKLLTSVMSILN